MGPIRSKNALLPLTLISLALAGCASAARDAGGVGDTPPLAPTPSLAPAPKVDEAPPPAAPALLAEAAATPAPSNEETTDVTVYANVWERLRAGFALPALDSPHIAQYEQWFVNNPEYMARKMERARLYLYYIVEEVEKRGMPLEIALLPAIESAYQPYAKSRARAVGLWQFISPTARLYGLKMNWWYDGRRDVEASTQAALDYLQKLYNDFSDWHLALAAYNAGEGKVMRMIDYNRRKGLPTSYPHLTRLKAETRHYVPKLIAVVNLVRDPARYGIELPDIPNDPYFARVNTGSQVDLGVVAQLADLPLDELHSINAGFMRWATDPDGPHRLLVPVEKKEVVLDALNSLPAEERIQYRHHQVRYGDTLYEIARRYGISVEAIKTANRLRSNLLRIGQSLLIPLSTRSLQLSTAVPRTAAPARTQRAGAPLIHRVRSGESLWSIARKYDVLIQQLVDWNLLDPNDVLRLGQRLKIWTSGGPSAALSLTPQS